MCCSVAANLPTVGSAPASPRACCPTNSARVQEKALRCLLRVLVDTCNVTFWNAMQCVLVILYSRVHCRCPREPLHFYGMENHPGCSRVRLLLHCPASAVSRVGIWRGASKTRHASGRSEVEILRNIHFCVPFRMGAHTACECLLQKGTAFNGEGAAQRTPLNLDGVRRETFSISAMLSSLSF
ncbi:hypothetical protein CSUI_002582 [Cystoisospora suis]|uniref:Uncharacterized protein n=1 Tax=Cystoisospora suis TaxID=483139 RepID=A0A2C6L460_9APIC|nr:hypothetical protein CSUI_002582 [Cystoisospora suis]